MADTIVEIRVPAPLLRLGLSREDVQQRVNEWLVLSLFTEGRISSGKAARLLNVTRIEFLALLRKRGIAYVDYTEDKLAYDRLAVEVLLDELDLGEAETIVDATLRRARE